MTMTNFAKPTMRADTDRAMQEISNGRKDWQTEKKRFLNIYEETLFKIQQMSVMLDRSFQKHMTQDPIQLPVRGRTTRNDDGDDPAPARRTRGAAAGATKRGRRTASPKRGK